MAAANDRAALGADAEHAVEEFEPDYRFTLANERTSLVWQRTTRGLRAAAVAVVQLVPELVIPGARHVVGGVFAALTIFTAVTGIHRWEQVNKAMRRGLPLPRHRIPLRLGAGLPLIAVLGLALIVSKAVWG